MTYHTLAVIIYTVGLGVLALATVIALVRHRKPLLLVLIAVVWILAAGFVLRLASTPGIRMARSILERVNRSSTKPATTDVTDTSTDTIATDTASIATEATQTMLPGSVDEKLEKIRAREPVKHRAP